MQYSKKRIIAFDTMRGLFMATIIIDHLGTAFGISLFIFLTGGGGLPVSAAEGFFLLSGFMVGFVYAPKFLAQRKKDDTTPPAPRWCFIRSIRPLHCSLYRLGDSSTCPSLYESLAGSAS